MAHVQIPVEVLSAGMITVMGLVMVFVRLFQDTAARCEVICEQQESSDEYHTDEGSVPGDRHNENITGLRYRFKGSCARKRQSRRCEKRMKLRKMTGKWDPVRWMKKHLSLDPSWHADSGRQPSTTRSLDARSEVEPPKKADSPSTSVYSRDDERHAASQRTKEVLWEFQEDWDADSLEKWEPKPESVGLTAEELKQATKPEGYYCPRCQLHAELCAGHGTNNEDGPSTRYEFMNNRIYAVSAQQCLPTEVKGNSLSFPTLRALLCQVRVLCYACFETPAVCKCTTGFQEAPFGRKMFHNPAQLTDEKKREVSQGEDRYAQASEKDILAKTRRLEKWLDAYGDPLHWKVESKPEESQFSDTPEWPRNWRNGQETGAMQTPEKSTRVGRAQPRLNQVTWEISTPRRVIKPQRGDHAPQEDRTP